MAHHDYGPPRQWPTTPRRSVGVVGQQSEIPGATQRKKSSRVTRCIRATTAKVAW